MTAVLTLWNEWFGSIPLPPWVQEEMSRNPGIVYADRSGRRNPEYISLGCDMLPVLRGRTPIQVYSDYMRSFRDRFRDHLGRVIVVSHRSLHHHKSIYNIKLCRHVHPT